MSEDKLPEDSPGDPAEGLGGTEDDVLRRAAREIRASASLQAFVPLSPAEREQLADAAIDRALGRALGRVLGRAVGEVSAPAGASAPVPDGTVAVAPLPRSRRRVRSVGAIAATLALAAAVVLVVRGGRRTVEPLAAYSIVIEGEQSTRGATQPSGPPGQPALLRPGTRLVVRLAAEKPERDALLRLVLVRNGRATLLDPPVTRGKAGALEIAGPAGELLGAQSDGAAELVVVLGRELPGDDEIRALALAASGEPPRHLQVLRRAIVLEGFSHAAIDVLLGGCSAVLGAPGARDGGLSRCEISAGARLHLWIGVPAAAAVAIDLDGRALPASAAARGGGSAFDVEVPTLPGRLSVRIDERELGAWELAPAASFAPVEAAEEARKAGRLDEADADLQAVSARAPPEEQLAAVRERAKIALRRGDVDRERALREHAVALARTLGRVSVESDETIAIIWGLINQHAYAQAVQRLHDLDVLGVIYAEGAMDRDYIHGFLASELGDLGAALGWFQRSRAVAERIRDAGGRAVLFGPLADVLQSLGRDEEARTFSDAELQRGAQEADVCARVDANTNAGWLRRDLDPPGGQALVDQAVALAAERCEGQLPVALVNQGWLLAAAGRFGEARGALDRLARGRHGPDARIQTWALRLEAEILLGEDPARAEPYAQQLAARAAELCSTELLYEAQLLRARALVVLGRPEQATAAFAEAERALTLWSSLVPLGEGRATFFQRHDQLALTAIPFFLAQVKRGEPGARLALAAAARHSIARFVTSLAGGGRARARAERGDTARDHTSQQFEHTLERWPVSPRTRESADGAVAGVCEARDAAARGTDDSPLTEPPPQAALFVHPAPQGLLVLAWRGASIDFREIPRAGAGEGPDALSARIARAAAPMLAGAPRVHLHVHRSLAALPLDRSLAALLAVPIAFAVDARARPPGASCPGPRRALLVTNPRQDLWAASASAPRVQGDLERVGFAVDTLEGAAATRAAIEARLADPCTALLHYDGHGSSAAQRTSGGGAGGGPRDRTDDALLLAGGDTLTAADVLDLPRVPPAVVLDGCTTAAPEGLGLAQAFLLAGAAQVVASIDELPAGDAARFTNRLFEAAPSSAASIDLVSLFSQAMSGTDIPALRVFER